MDARRRPYGAGRRWKEVSADQHGSRKMITAINLGHV